jgi:hypothetical protein
MATYVGDSHAEISSFYHHPPPTTTTTASSVLANTSPTTMPTFSKASEGLEGLPVWIFTTTSSMQKTIDSNRKKLETSKAGPYLIFRPVTKDDLLDIEHVRVKTVK